MRYRRLREARIRSRVLKRDANLPEYGAPTVEALSRWENDGGAPDRCSELRNRTAPGALPQLADPRAAANIPQISFAEIERLRLEH
jgi:hypothetical protein